MACGQITYIDSFQAILSRCVESPLCTDMRNNIDDQLSHLALDEYVVKNDFNHNEWLFMPQSFHRRNGKFPNFKVI